MTAVKLNREFALRHLGVALLFLGMGGWFGYDGFVAYPATEATALYAKCHKGAAAESAAAAERFKAAAIPRQRQFMAIFLVLAAVVSAGVARAAAFRLEFDEAGFVWRSRHHGWADVAGVDRSRWAKKGIAVVLLKSGERIKLDAWHHTGVKELLAKLPEAASA